ncbi:ferric reductase-like transmembrane domain-containing protein [Clostridiaceae bacterium M8S5]|nr:ferric reductase-like transmembrane domain-containing protein [Clostridiaceae bacterium M8S5]
MNILMLRGTTELIISIAITAILYFKFKDSIKKNSKSWYLGSTIISGICMAISIMVFIGLWNIDFSIWWVRMIRGIASGYFPASIFMFVMYAGALTHANPYKKTLMSIRTEMSIIGVIFYLPHTILYTAFSAPYGIKALIAGDIQLIPQLMTWTGLINSILLIVLGITSSRKMKARLNSKWKKLHKWSYLFYFNCFVHYMTLSISRGRYERSVIYVLVYGIYLMMKIRKEAFSKKSIGA